MERCFDPLKSLRKSKDVDLPLYFQSSVRLRMMCNCSCDTRRQRLTTFTPHPRAIRGVRYPLFCPSIFDGFFKEFISIVFLPSRRWSSLICFMAAASSEAGTTCSPAATAVRLPSWYCLRQRNNWLPHRVAVQRERLSSPVQGSAEQYRFFLSGTPSAFLRS